MSTDRALALMSGLVVDDVGTHWGAIATEWQWDDAIAFLGDDGPRMHFVTRPRGGSKTSDLAGMALVALVEQLPAVSQSYAVAADLEQSRLLLEAMQGFIRRTPGLRGALKADLSKVTNVSTGATLRAMAADGPGMWGLLPHMMIVDEIAQWKSSRSAAEVWEAVLSAMPKIPGSRMACLTSAGDPAHWAYKVLQHAQRSALWRVSEMPGPAPWQDPAELAEQKGLLTDSAYARLYGNVWAAPEDRAFDIDDLRACLLLDGPQKPAAGKEYVIGLDLGLTNDRTVLVVAHREAVGVVDTDGWDEPPQTSTHRVVVDRVQSWKGSKASRVSLEEVGNSVWSTSREFNNARVVTDPWQAVHMAERLRRDGVAIEEFTFSASSVARISMTLVRLVRDRLLVLPRHPVALFDELARVRLRESSPGVVRMDHKSGEHDDHAMALALAAHTLSANEGGSALGYLNALAAGQATCTSCGHESRPGSWWCAKCGANLPTPRVAA